MNDLVLAFVERYGDVVYKVVKSPLRICPLGAHVDHQGGVVTGMAIDQSIDLIFMPDDEGYVQVQSFDFPDEDYFHLDKVPEGLKMFWGNYVRGAVRSLSRDYKLKRGFRGMISGKIPIGGLSSSAAVTTAYLMALCDVNGITLSGMELVKYSHWVETDFIGLKNGILDQTANILSRDKHLLFMDCENNNYRLIPNPVNMDDFEVVIVYSGITKQLIGTDYNNRVDECKVAAWILQELKNSKISTLRDVKLRDVDSITFETYERQMPGRFARRARHFFSECERVRKGLVAWENNDLKAFGALMFESGESSIYNYECGREELVNIFETLRSTPGVYGARFSGAGYRGCCIGIIDPAYREAVKRAIDESYPVAYPEYKDVYKVHFCKTDDGARILSSEEY